MSILPLGFAGSTSMFQQDNVSSMKISTRVRNYRQGLEYPLSIPSDYIQVLAERQVSLRVTISARINDTHDLERCTYQRAMVFSCRIGNQTVASFVERLAPLSPQEMERTYGLIQTFLIPPITSNNPTAAIQVYRPAYATYPYDTWDGIVDLLIEPV